MRCNDDNVLTGDNFNALKSQIQRLESKVDAFSSGYESVMAELIWFHQGLPKAWSNWYIENHHRHRLPESVMADLRQNLQEAA